MLTGSNGLVEAQIKDWVTAQVCAVSKEHGRCKKIVLRHLNVERKPDADVHTVNIASDPAFEGTEIVDKVVLEIADAAQRDANDYKAGVQIYGAYAYYTNTNAAGYAPRKMFRVGAEEDFDPASGPSEPASEKGLLAQLMRHNEINSKNSLVAMGYIFQTFQKEIEQQRSMNRQFMQQQLDMIALQQETLDTAHKRRQEEKKTDMEMSVIEGVFEHLKVILPILANRIAGKEILTPRMDREMYLFASFLEGLTPEQQQYLRTSMNPQQLTMLAELLGLYEERKAKLIGEGKRGEDQADDKQAPGQPASPPSSKKNPLLSLFEKRKNLVNKADRLESGDEVMRKIEEKAARIKQRLEFASNEIRGDNEK